MVCPMLSDRCLSCPVCLDPVCDVGVLWPNGWMDQYETWHGSRPRPRPHCVRWGPSCTPTGAQLPQFSAHVYCGQTAGWIKMPLGTKVGIGPGDIVLDADPAPPIKRGRAAPTFRPMYCGRMAGWIKMPLNTEVGLGSGHIVLDGSSQLLPLPAKKGGHSSPAIFGPCLL